MAPLTMTPVTSSSPFLPAFLPPSLPLTNRHILPKTRPRHHACPRAAHNGPARPLRRLSRALVITAAALSPALTMLPSSVQARENKSVITMTDQVPNFTLPSQERAISPNRNAILSVVTSVARRVVPPVAIAVIAIWVIRIALRRAQEKQLRDFQAQLSSFSSMLDLDAADRPAPSDRPVAESASRARDMLDESRSRYRFRGDTTTSGDADEAETKVRLDLFRDGTDTSDTLSDPKPSPPSSSTTATTAAAPTVSPSSVAKAAAETLPPISAEPQSALERAVADVLQDAKAGRADKIQTDVEAACQNAGLSAGEATAAVVAFLSRAVSAAVDSAAAQLSGEDAAVLAALQEVGATTKAARMVAPDARLVYGGVHARDDVMVEEIYRRYALFCLSGAPATDDGSTPEAAEGLADMQTILGVGDARAETINTEIAKGMFQVAVSAAMADGSLSDEDRKALESVKDSFGSFLDGSSADSIVSEVAVMRAMYSLQQLLQDQGVSAEDVQELRKMCSELGVDIDEMLQNADALGDALGPEAKDFVESLRGLITSSKKEDEGK